MANQDKILIRIDKFEFKDTRECLASYDNKKFKYSPWIENIVNKYNYKYNNNSKPIELIKKSVQNLGFTKPQELKTIYVRISELGYGLVSPEIAIYARLLYTNQKNGEWIRFATPLDSMIDTDGIHHLPKLGKAFNLFFIETYWSYPNSIFHPHNEFILTK
tara:strand:- start:170 stop:652 length:483 start_codon:yes stop_codon:yes gene_type:complete